MKRRKSLITFLTFVLIILTTFSYSALSTRFQVIIDVQFRADANIRITDILLDSTSNGGLISFDSNYTKNTITSGFKLPNLNSTVSYNVTITNKGNIDQAIYNITTISSSNNNIYYLIDDKPINEVLPMIVPLGTSKTIKITYKTTSPFSNTETIVNNFEFKKVYYVDYNLKGGSYTNDQNDLKNGQIKYEDVDLTLTNEKPTKSKYVFVGWTDEQNGTTVKYQSGSTYTLNEDKIMYAVWRTGEATFISGSQFNSKIKILAGNANATYSTQDTNITSIVRANSLPNGFTPTEANIVSTSTSDFPIYAWYSNGTIYYYTVVDNLYMNSNGNHMFENLTNVESIEINTINTSRTTSMWSTFLNCFKLSSLDLSNFNTENVTSLQSTFQQCNSLESLDLSSFNTSNVTTMNRMFYGCSSLTTIDVSSFNTSKATDINSMFSECTRLQNITFGSNFDTSNVIDIAGMFWNCSSLTSLDLSGFDTSKVEYIHVMFSGCSSLTSLDLSSFDLSRVTRNENMLLSMTSLRQLKTPKVYPSNLSITLPNTFYDPSNNAYQTLSTGSPVETWIKLPYTVKYNSNSGTGTMADQKIGVDATTTLTTNAFTRENYTFVGWNIKADGTGTAYLDEASVSNLGTYNQTINLYAQWAGISYIVTANADGGTIPSTSGWTGTGNTSTKTVNFGSAYGTLPTPTTPGYQFAGWNGKNLFEVGTLDDYYIYYQSGMNVSISNNKISSTILEGQMAFIRNEKHTYTAGNYVFKYQSSNGNKRHLIYPYDENGNILTDSDISISGWTYNQSYGGWFSNLLDSEYSTAVIPEEVSYWKYGIVFTGAISEFGDTLEVSNIMIEEGVESTPYEPYFVTSSTPLTRNEDHTLYAKWTPNTYSIVFDKNDNAATGTMNNQSMTYGTSSNLTNNSYYKRGFKFVGWNTASDGTGTAYLNSASVSNLTNVNNGTITLYAQWEKLMAEDVGHTIQDLNCEDVQCVIDELYYMLY